MEGLRVVAALECAESLTAVGLGCVYQLLKVLKELDFHGFKGASIYPQPFSYYLR